MNKFKLWINKNGLKIAVIAIIIILIYIIIKNVNGYYKKVYEETQNKIAKENVGVNIKEESEENLNKITEETDKDDYQYVIKASKKLISTINEAKLNKDNDSLRQDICYMLSDQLASKIYSENRYDENFKLQDNVLDYVIYVEDENDLSIGEIYCYSKSNGIARYIVELIYKDEKTEENMTIYMVMDLDYNNKTFWYNGVLDTFDEIEEMEIVEGIPNDVSNIFE